MRALLLCALIPGLLACETPAPDPVDAATELVPPAGAPPDSISADLTVRVLRVSARSGGGDAILVADSSVDPARHVLIDAGDDADAADALARLGVDSLDLMVLTHAHFDHYGGMDEVLERMPVRAFAFSGQPRTAVTYERLLRQVRERVPTVLVVEEPRTVRLGAGDAATTITLLPPLRRYVTLDTDDGEELNEASLAIRIERGTFSFLTTGDAEDEANRYFAVEFPELVDVDVLKVGHHGSTDATQHFWLDATTPEVAVISANGTTHPHAEIVELLRTGRGIDLYCTPQHGAVTIRVGAAGEYVVRTESDPARACRPGSERGGD